MFLSRSSSERPPGCCRWALELAAGALAGLSTQARADALPGQGRATSASVSPPDQVLPWLLLAVFCVGAVLWWRLRQRGVAGAWGGLAGMHVRTRALRRLESQALTPHVSVHLVEWEGESLLIACSPEQVRVVARRKSPQGETQ